MTRKHFVFLSLSLIFLFICGTRTLAQEVEPRIQVNVDMVQLNVAVTDNKGNYITGLEHPGFRHN